ncbi:hypothetical protein JVT61DRAFT_8419 [Boletus reticuloceps]|uniref:BHLH domain-containing protein n=1 Tax=Boletus reticuloceps TaxID=495285 RepID=A0A8I2YY91_9AGAM|nr:hypothetical protein JVT61DRAFT_8419 [Boletus reticuloceps]
MSSSFRPIAPAEDVYAASCNPPRRAKRLRSDSSPLSSPSQPDDDDDAAPSQSVAVADQAPSRKARRTKINDALATLRDLVPPEYKRPSESHPDDSDDDDDDDPKRPRQKPKAQPEKEFKLEILIRTVAYLQDLMDRVKQLEHDGCPRCSEPISFAADRRKCPADADTSRASSVAPHSRLPSISAWLPEDQRSLLLTPSQSPTFGTAVAARSTQLPTPPTSTICAPATTGYQIPPVLTLPSPCTRLPSATTTAHILPRFSGFASRPRPSVPSPASSPTYTPDDETAASLLLRMSTTSPRTASNGVPPRPVEAAPSHVSSAGCGALTPSRLLGLSAER